MSATVVNARSNGLIALCLLGFAQAVTGAEGAAVYKANCAKCHGESDAPKFVGKSPENVKSAINDGKGKMKPVALDSLDADAVARYVAGSERATTNTSRSKGPSPAASKIARGVQLAAANQDTLALFEFLDAIYLDPVSVEARLKLAEQYARVGHPERAVQQWEFVLMLEPTNDVAVRRLRETRGPGEAGAVGPAVQPVRREPRADKASTNQGTPSP